MCLNGTILKRGANFSGDRRYRYRLTREWDETKHVLIFVMLNPSTANETTDDPTIRRCIAFAKAWGYGAIHIVNLYALVSTAPTKLISEPDSIGGVTNDYLKLAAFSADKIIVAWGNHGADNQHRVDFVLGILCRHKDVYCLGKNQNGQPKHPLYVSKMPEASLLLFKAKL